MEIENSSLYREISAIITSGAKPVHYSWSAQIHANNIDYPAMKVIQVDIMRDYETNYSDVIVAKMAFPKGTYWQKIYPYADNLECTLFKYPLAETGDTVNLALPLETERYIAMLDKQGSPLLENTGMNQDTQGTLNLQDFETVEIELIDRSLNQMRMITVGGVFRSTTNEKVMRAMMTAESQKVVVDNARLNKGVEMVPSNNQTVRDHVIIPQGTPLAHVPQWIHQKCGGVYSAGLGYYLQDDYWFIYPCFDPTRANKSAPALTIINMPKNRFTGIERTYRQNGDSIVLLATGDVKFRDYSNQAQLNKGNGVRFTDASKVMEGFVTVKDNIATASRGAVNTEAITTARPNGLNNAQTSPRAINANPYLEFSDMAKRNGSQIALTWENSNPSLIKPGMLVQVMYLDNETVSQIYGVMLKAHHHVRMQGSGMTTTRHVTDSALSVFVQRPLGNGDSTGQGVLNAS